MRGIRKIDRKQFTENNSPKAIDRAESLSNGKFIERKVIERKVYRTENLSNGKYIERKIYRTENLSNGKFIERKIYRTENLSNGKIHRTENLSNSNLPNGKLIEGKFIKQQLIERKIDRI